MSLLDEMKTECVLMEQTRAPDGEGGSHSAWTQKERFRACLVLDASLEVRIAGKQAADDSYTVTADRALPYHAAFRRLSDGRTFRVTSEPRTPPERAAFRFFQATAERWELPV